MHISAVAGLVTRRHALVHLNLVLAGLLLLPVVLPVDWFDAPNHNPVGLVLGGLSVSIGLPFLVLSAGAPLMQKWFAQCEHGAAEDPYFLYAASNAGSIAGLLAYLILERQLTLSQQIISGFRISPCTRLDERVRVVLFAAAMAKRRERCGARRRKNLHAAPKRAARANFLPAG